MYSNAYNNYGNSNARQTRRRSSFSELAGDHAALWQLMKKINALPEQRPNILPDQPPRIFRLRLTFRGKPYTVRLIVHKTFGGNLYLTINENECIKIIYDPAHEKPFKSQIYADTADRRCFEPAPNTSAFRMTDLLMVLTTKLMIAISKYAAKDPNYDDGSAKPITITDIAKKDFTAITPYKVLRGETGLYERYGYVSAELDDIRRDIVNRSFKAVPQPYRSQIEKIVNARRAATGRPLVKMYDEPTWQVMRDLTWDEVSGLSQQIVEEYLRPSNDNYYDEDAGNINLELDESSDAWKRWDAEMQVVGVGRWNPRRHTKRR
jgi:hypothetical protein